jgi:hypothetical protein
MAEHTSRRPWLLKGAHVCRQDLLGVKNDSQKAQQRGEDADVGPFNNNVKRLGTQRSGCTKRRRGVLPRGDRGRVSGHVHR